MAGRGALVLIRHGQASFDGPDYDVLSDLGCEQGVRLGTWLAHSGRAIDKILTGPLRRQVDTAAALREGAGAADKEFPEASVMDGWTEYPAIRLLKQGVPLLAEKDDELREMLGELEGDDENASLASYGDFEKLFVRVQRAWMNDELSIDGCETFGEFKLRVREALEAAFDEVGDGRGLVVTSGGPVGVAMQEALDIHDDMTMRMTTVVANSAMTTLRRRKGGYLLTSFNALPHLRDPKLITFR
jgi:broad specificity phosphatase PhoE